MKAHIFLIIHVKFYSSKVLSLEDINENVPGYGNHNEVYTVRYVQQECAELALYTQTAWPFQLKCQIYIFEVMIL